MAWAWRRPVGSLSLFAALLGFSAAFWAPQAHAVVGLNTGGSSYVVQVRSFRDIPFRTVVRQQYDYSCGSASLATLLRFHYGVDVDETTVFKAMFAVGNQEQIRKVGFSLLDMKTYLEKNGYKADGFRMSLDDLAKTGLPAIAVISIGPYRHFVVIKGINKEKVLVGDPALGLKSYPRAEFLKMWNSIVFLIHDSETKAAFNKKDEWDPWSRAPVQDRLDRQSLFGINVAIAPVYQITQFSQIQ